MSRYVEVEVMCQYHGGAETVCRIVELTPDGREWQEPKAVCGQCRAYLRGYFRYAQDVTVAVDRRVTITRKQEARP